MGGEAHLRELVRRGELAEATEWLYRCHADDVARFVRFLRPRASVDDLCQDVWLAVRRSLPRFRFESTPRTWLFATVKRRLADERRRQRRHPLVHLPSTSERLQEVLLGSVAGPRRPATPSSQLRRKRRAAILQQELGGLEPDARELLELRFVENLTPAQIVELLGLADSPNTVSKRIVRSVRALRQKLLGHDEFKSA